MTPMTLQRAAQMALDVQNASNLSGVIYSFADITAWMRAELRLDTAAYNTHPICQLFADKIADLTGIRTPAAPYFKADDACRHLAYPPATTGQPVAGCYCPECAAVRARRGISTGPGISTGDGEGLR